MWWKHTTTVRLQLLWLLWLPLLQLCRHNQSKVKLLTNVEVRHFRGCINFLVPLLYGWNYITNVLQIRNWGAWCISTWHMFHFHLLGGSTSLCCVKGRHGRHIKTLTLNEKFDRQSMHYLCEEHSCQISSGSDFKQQSRGFFEKVAPTRTTKGVAIVAGLKKVNFAIHIIGGWDKLYVYEPKDWVIYRDKFSVSSITTGFMWQLVTSAGTPIPLVVVSMHSKVSGWSKNNVTNTLFQNNTVYYYRCMLMQKSINENSLSLLSNDRQPSSGITLSENSPGPTKKIFARY